MVGALLILSFPARSAQTDRYLVNLKLRAFEAAWEKQPDKTKRKQAAAILEPLTFSLLAGNLTGAAQLLDHARFKLVDLPENDRWAQAVAVRVTQPLLDAGKLQVRGKLVLAYPLPTTLPERITLDFLNTGNAQEKPAQDMTTSFSLNTLTENSQDFLLNLPKGTPEGNFDLRFAIRNYDRTVTNGSVPLVLVPDLEKHIAQLEVKADSIKKLTPSIGRSTWLLMHSRITQAVQGKNQETDYPYARWLAELNLGYEVVERGEKWPNPIGANPVWLALPLKNGDKVVRIEGAARDGKTPMTTVVTLHGAGGSENLFCEGYGRLAPILAEKNGWMLISPLNGPSDELLDRLTAWQPIDVRRVVAIGHSMGAAHATAWAVHQPRQLRAVAALGGGGRVGNGEAWERLPFFVGVGDKDFALKSAKNLADSLKKNHCRSVDLRVYPGLEHITVVQACLGDVFAFFKEILDGKDD